MNIKYGKIPFGLKDISKYLGIKDDKVLFFHSLSFAPNDKNRRIANEKSMIYAEILSFACNEGPKFASCYYNNELLAYLNKSKIININNLILLGENKKINYPYNSVSKMLKQKLDLDKILRKELNGYTIVSSFISEDDEETAKLINGKTLMKAKDQVKFDSKFFMRIICKKYNFSIPVGVAFCGINNLDNALNKLQHLGIKKAWLKLESLTSGNGNLYIEDINNVTEIRNKLVNLSEKFYGKAFDDKYLNEEIHIIIEEDLSNKEIINVGVEAVISDKEITILGSVAQKTENGTYRGSYLCEGMEVDIKIAEEEAGKLFYAYQQEGYRGCITVDVLVTDDNKAYNIDPNARFSAGSMLLKNLHTSEYYTGKKMYGLSFANAIPKKNNLITDLFEYIGNNLYKGIDSNYEGIIPALLNDVNSLDDGKYYLKTVVIADSYEKAEKMYQEFKNKIKLDGDV